MRAKAHGLTRPITRNQAKAYELTTPNGRGVTAIAAVSNGRRLRPNAKSSSDFAKRYAQTRELLTRAKKPARRNASVIAPARALENRRHGMSPAQAAALARGRAALEARRRAAAKVAGHRSSASLVGVAHLRSPAAPRKNAMHRRSRVSPLANAMEPKIMMYNANKKGKKKSGKRKAPRSAAQKAATKRMLAAAAKKRAGKAAPKRRKSARKAAPKRTRRAAPKRARKAAPNRARKSHVLAHRFEQNKAAPKRKYRRVRHATKTRSVAQRRATGAMLMARWGKKFSPRYWKNPRRKHASRNAIYMPNMFYMNNGRKKHYRKSRRHAHRNPDFKSILMGALKSGAIVSAGFITQRLLANIARGQLLKMTSQPKLAEFAASPLGILAVDAAVAAAGVVLAGKVAPKFSNEIAAGMIAAVVQHAAMSAVGKFFPGDNGMNALYLAGYPDADGYQAYSMSGHRGHMLNGVGAYEQMPPGYSGYGALGEYTQAAAGFGALTQAAAGVGEYTQAAAGVGEYFAQGVSGIGEYEAVSGFGTSELMDEGIHPNLTAAERELSVAEAVAGLGGTPDANYRSIVQAQQVAAPVLDAPGGSRAGILQGGDGIFG